MKGFEIFSNEVKTDLNIIVRRIIDWFDGENVDKVEEFDIVETLTDNGYDDNGDGIFDKMVEYIIDTVNAKLLKGNYTMCKSYSIVEADGYPTTDEYEVDMYKCLSFEGGIVSAEYED